MTAHTPGPWRDNSYTADGKLELACAVWDAAGKVPIASTRFSIGKREAPNKEVCHANARLIAAAPDLLSALQALFEHCAMTHKHWGEGSNQREAAAAQAAARAAINKAIGG